MLWDLLDSARHGRGAAIVLHGDAGVGKTALLDHVVAAASDFRTIRIAGTESETRLPFAGLHGLLQPFLEGACNLADLQGDVLRAVFGRTTQGRVDRFLIGVAALNLLAQAARCQPLCCVIDDVHHLDSDSLDALAFVGRRLQSSHVALLLSTGVATPALADLPRLDLPGLPDDTALALLKSMVDGRLDRHVAERIVRETDGNPLAIAELSRELSADQLNGTSRLPSPLPIGRRLEAHFMREVTQLPKDTQRLLLAAAAEPSADPAVLARVANQLQISVRALEPALKAGTSSSLDARPNFQLASARFDEHPGASQSDPPMAHHEHADRLVALSTSARDACLRAR